MKHIGYPLFFQIFHLLDVGKKKECDGAATFVVGRPGNPMDLDLLIGKPILMYEPFFTFLENYGPLPAGFREAVSAIIQPKHFAAGSLLVKEGAYNTQFFFIIKGIVRGYYYDSKGKEITNWFLREGQLVAPSEGYYFRTPSLDNVQALEDCQVLMLSFQDVEGFYQQFPVTERFGRMASMQYSIYWRIRFKEFRGMSVAERYQQLLLNFPDVVQRVKVQYIASYLNTTRFHLSRIRAKR